jgi:prolyl-tRNA editing enzyme YbaK/EbsC (Cys-tRNA(Pro) deacylase)
VGTFNLGTLAAVPVGTRRDLVSPVTLAALDREGMLDRIGAVEIDPAVSDTTATQQAFGLPLDSLANCVVVGGKREGVERIAASLVLATTRVDVNNMVKRRLDVRKASFLPIDRTVELTKMEYGGITPIGLPDGWPVLVDARVVVVDVIVIGSGIRKSKLLLPGSLVPHLANVEIVEGLARQI